MSDARRLLTEVKASARPAPAHAFVLAAGAPIHSLLRPVTTAPRTIDRAEVQRLTRWRNDHVTAFLSRFKATDDRTAAWLAEVVGPATDRILFIVEDLRQRAYGAMGIAAVDWDTGTYELDGVVRGEEPPQPSAMADALDGMTGWARAQLGLGLARASVFADSPAVGFYERLGFERDSEALLRLRRDGDTETWVEDASAPVGGPILLHLHRRDSVRP